MSILTKYEIENSNHWREIKFLWVDPFQKLTFPINLPLTTTSLSIFEYSKTNKTSSTINLSIEQKIRVIEYLPVLTKIMLNFVNIIFGLLFTI